MEPVFGSPRCIDLGACPLQPFQYLGAMLARSRRLTTGGVHFMCDYFFCLLEKLILNRPGILYLAILRATRIWREGRELLKQLPEVRARVGPLRLCMEILLVTQAQ